MRSAVFLLAACLSLSGMLAAAPSAALAASTPTTQEIAALGNLDTAPSKAAKPAKGKATKVTNNPASEQAGPVDGTLPSTGRGEVAASATDEEKAALLRAVLDTGGGPAPIIPKGMGIEFLAPSSDNPPPQLAAGLLQVGILDPAGDLSDIKEPVADFDAADLRSETGAGIAALLDEHLKRPMLPIHPLVDDGSTLLVIGPPDGRRRIGHRFGPHPIPLRAADLTTDQLVALYSDPLLTIRLG